MKHMKNKILERDFRERVVLPFLKELDNCDFTPIQQLSHCGDPDYMLCVAGKLVGLELKTDKGILSELQTYKLSCIVAAGGYAFVARPCNWDIVKSKLLMLSKGEELLRNYIGFEPVKAVKLPLKPAVKVIKRRARHND